MKLTQREKIRKMLLKGWVANHQLVKHGTESLRRVRELRASGEKVLKMRGNKNGKHTNTWYYTILQ